MECYDILIFSRLFVIFNEEIILNFRMKVKENNNKNIYVKL